MHLLIAPEVGMKICVQGGMGINYLIIEEVGEDYLVARFLTGTKHQQRWPLLEWGTVILPAFDQ